jgi:hypothetical protein
MWRPQLHPIKEGTSLVFDRRELDELFDALKREARAELQQLLGERLARRQRAPAVAVPAAPAPQADDAAA